MAINLPILRKFIEKYRHPSTTAKVLKGEELPQFELNKIGLRSGAHFLCVVLLLA
jgi:hypothetical protein